MRARARGGARRLRRNTREFDAEGRVLRLKRYVSAVAGSAVLNAVLDALAVNTRVEVLYIQNFERGFTDAQLARLTEARPHEKRTRGSSSGSGPARPATPRRRARARARDERRALRRSRRG